MRGDLLFRVLLLISGLLNYEELTTIVGVELRTHSTFIKKPSLVGTIRIFEMMLFDHKKYSLRNSLFSRDLSRD